MFRKIWHGSFPAWEYLRAAVGLSCPYIRDSRGDCLKLELLWPCRSRDKRCCFSLVWWFCVWCLLCFLFRFTLIAPIIISCGQDHTWSPTCCAPLQIFRKSIISLGKALIPCFVEHLCDDLQKSEHRYPQKIEYACYCKIPTDWASATCCLHSKWSLGFWGNSIWVKMLVCSPNVGFYFLYLMIKLFVTTFLVRDIVLCPQLKFVTTIITDCCASVCLGNCKKCYRWC